MSHIFICLQHCLPHKTLSRLFGAAAECRIRWVKNSMIRWFIRRYHIDLTIAASDKLEDYPHFNAFFTRHLKPEARPLLATENQIACPADGNVSECGAVENNTLLQAKGKHYQVAELLADKQMATHFSQGSFCTVYLSPTDYHRVHLPRSGRLLSMTYVPGRLFSVNPTAANGIDNLFARNERVVCLFDTAQGKMAVVFVGAMIVGSIGTDWHGVICPPHAQKIQTWHYTDRELYYQQGQEIGYFKFGSTAIVLTDNACEWDIGTGDKVMMGAALTK